MTMNKYTNLFAGLALVAGMLAASCTNEDYPVYDTDQKDGVYIAYEGEKAETDSIHYEYGFQLLTQVTLKIPVKLMGMPTDRERTFGVKVIKEQTTMTEGVHYSIDESKLKLGPNQLEGAVEITFYRDKDPELTDTTYIISLELQETEDLKAIQGQSFFQITYSDKRPTKPEWWDENKLDVYNFEVAQWFFHYFYLTEETNPPVFNELINRYGEYFVDAVKMQGPLAMYDNFFAKYVLTPLYEQYKDHPTIKIPKPSLN